MSDHRVPSLFNRCTNLPKDESSARLQWLQDNFEFRLPATGDLNAFERRHPLQYHFGNIDTNYLTPREFDSFKMDQFTPEIFSRLFFNDSDFASGPDELFLFNEVVVHFEPRTWELFQKECLAVRHHDRTISEYDLFKAGVGATQMAYLHHIMPDIPVVRAKKDPKDPTVILHKKRTKENADIRKHPGYTYNVPGASQPVFRVWDFERRKTRYLANVPLTNWDRQAFDDPKEMKTHCGWLPALAKTTNWDWKRQVLVVDYNPIVVLDVDQPFEKIFKSIKVDKLWKWANDKDVLVTPSFSGNTHIFLRIDMSGMTDALSVDKEDRKKVDPQEWHQYYKHTRRYSVLQQYRGRLAASLTQDTGIEVDQVCLRNEAIAYRPCEIAQVNEFFSGKKPIPMIMRELPEPQVLLVINEAKQTEKLPDYRADRIEGFIKEFRKFLDFKIIAIDEVMGHVDDCLETKAGKTEYYKKALDIMDLHFERIVAHWKENLDNLWPLRAKKESIGIAKAEFNEKYLGLPTEKYSTYFRQIFCYMASLGLENEYIKGKKTKDYKALSIPGRMFFSEELLNVSWREYQGHSQYSSITDRQLAGLLGNGNTFAVLTKCVAPIMIQYGRPTAQKLIERAILLSEANDKESRIAFVSKKIDWLIRNNKVRENAVVSNNRQENQGVRSEGVGECDISSGGLQHNQCSSGEGSGPEGVRQPVRRPVLQTCVYGNSKAQKDRQALCSSQLVVEQAEIFGLHNHVIPESKLKLKPRAAPSG